jgi:hypothetical protein
MLSRAPGEFLNIQRLCSLMWDGFLSSPRCGSYRALLSQFQRKSNDGFIEEWHLSIFATKSNAEDQPTWNVDMNGPFVYGFRKACESEDNTSEDQNCWDVVDRPLERPVIAETWVFRSKRSPDGSMRKIKASFCAF